jgi:hypothetical protein
MSPWETSAWIIIMMLLYLLPSLIAGARHHKNGAPIFALNLFMGWTVIGWAAAFIWALTYQDAPGHRY